MNNPAEIIIRSGNVVPFPGRRINAPDRGAAEQIIGALNDNRVGLAFQPQFCLATGQMSGAEALLRLRDESGGVLDALTVIETAEQESLIDWLGHAVMSLACQEFARLRAAGSALPRLAINVSPLELRQASYADDVSAAISDSGLAYEDIELEITESATLADPSLILQHLEVLEARGVRLAIDDFGSGHTAWAHVLELPISTLKIDRSLVSRVQDSKKASVVVRNICSTAKQLGLDVVAEGVQDAEHQAYVRTLGCSVGQGFGLARPVSADELLEQTR